MTNKKTTKPVKEGKFTGVGRRKRATAVAVLFQGKGEITINGMSLEKFFPVAHEKWKISQPFVVTDQLGKFDATVRVTGGGRVGQLDSCSLAISRALVLVSEEFKSALRQNGLLTRDPREKERRKVGTGGKARRQKQSPKR